MVSNARVSAVPRRSGHALPLLTDPTGKKWPRNRRGSSTAWPTFRIWGYAKPASANVTQCLFNGSLSHASRVRIR